VSWELHARKSRLEEREIDGEEGGEGEWRAEEVKTQEEKCILAEGSINFSKRYITDIPTYRIESKVYRVSHITVYT
jgi:hypothetical protein